MGGDKKGVGDLSCWNVTVELGRIHTLLRRANVDSVLVCQRSCEGTGSLWLVQVEYAMSLRRVR